jgi:hypothetical protein
VPPLVLGEADFAQEGVQMPGQRLHQLLQPRIAGRTERGGYVLDEFLFARLLLGRHPRVCWPAGTPRSSNLRSY